MLVRRSAILESAFPARVPTAGLRRKLDTEEGCPLESMASSRLPHAAGSWRRCEEAVDAGASDVQLLGNIGGRDAGCLRALDFGWIDRGWAALADAGQLGLGEIPLRPRLRQGRRARERDWKAKREPLAVGDVMSASRRWLGEYRPMRDKNQ